MEYPGAKSFARQYAPSAGITTSALAIAPQGFAHCPRPSRCPNLFRGVPGG